MKEYEKLLNMVGTLHYFEIISVIEYIELKKRIENEKENIEKEIQKIEKIKA